MDVRRALRELDDDLARRWLLEHDEQGSVFDMGRLEKCYMKRAHVPETNFFDTSLRIALFSAGNYVLGMVGHEEADGIFPRRYSDIQPWLSISRG